MIKKRKNLDELRWKFERRIVNKVKDLLLEKYNYKCANCSATEKLQVDHIKALSLGGSNKLSNLQILCKLCNTSKGGRRLQKGELFWPSYIVRVRIPKDIKEKIKEEAKKEERTYNNMIIYILKSHLRNNETSL